MDPIGLAIQLFVSKANSAYMNVSNPLVDTQC